MIPDITFFWKGKTYTVEGHAYDLSRIVLPDGTLLKVTSWLESNPPQVGSAQEITCLFTNETPSEIAQQMNACVAKPA